MTGTSAVLRPIGFHPWEISAMVNQEVIDQHAEEAAFLWTQRDRATGAPQYALKDLAKLDERVEAHVDGLRVAGSAGWQTALAQLEQGPGEVFAASVLAFEDGRQERTQSVLAAGCATPVSERGLVSALGWIDAERAVREAQKLLASREPEMRRAGLAGLAVHRIDPGEALEVAIADNDPHLAARAMRTAGELGRVDLVPAILQHLRDNDEDCRFWSAWSAARLSGRNGSGVISVLRDVVEKAGPLATRGIELAFRVMTMGDAQAWRLQLAGQATTLRLSIVGAGVIGDPDAMPWLIAQMENPELARVAGAAFSAITGADLAFEDLDQDPPATDLEDDSWVSDADADLRWPESALVTKWWVKRSANFVPGVRYLLGQPMTESSLLGALAKGKQNQRAAAALELAVRNPSQILFETRERAQRQVGKVRQWSS